MQNIITQLLNSRSLKTLNETLQTSPETNFRFIYSFIYLFIFFVFCSQMYIELFGPGQQPKGVWDSVRLRVRHLSRGYFRAGNGQIKSYHQPITEFRTLKFDRFSISDEQRCRAHKSKGDKASKFSYFLINREFLVCNRVTRRPCWKWKQYNVFFFFWKNLHKLQAERNAFILDKPAGPPWRSRANKQQKSRAFNSALLIAKIGDKIFESNRVTSENKRIRTPLPSPFKVGIFVVFYR